MRLDRFLTLAVFQPLRRAGPGEGEPRLPILMYHSISDGREERKSAYYQTATHPKVFADQMAMLRAEGYQAVTLTAGLETLQSWMTNGKGNFPRCVAVTFDDGFRDFYTVAFPILQQHEFAATMFLPTSYIGQQARRFKSRECLTWSEVKELHRVGMEFGSHTVTHPRLVELDWPDIEKEMNDSKAQIDDHLGVPAKAFAYPYAFPEANQDFVQHFRQLLGKAGYRSSVTTKIGRAHPGDDRLCLKRLPVNSGDDTPLFRAKLHGAYDWLSWPQAFSKTARHLVERGRKDPALLSAVE